MPFGALFGALVDDFWRFVGFCWIAPSMQQELVFSFLGGPRWALIRSLFQEWISGCVFMRFCKIFCDFKDHLGSLWPPFRILFWGFSEFVQGRCKSRLRGAKTVIFLMVRVQILRDFGYPFVGFR